MKTYPQIRRALAGKIWLVHEQKLQEMLALLELRLSGGVSAPEVLQSIRAGNLEAAARAKASAGSGGAIAVLPIYGMLMHRTMIDMSGGSAGTSCSAISAALQAAMADPNVGSVVLDIDSPGGDVDGVDELASEIYQARKQKRIVAVSNCLCASAAYYLAAQCSEIVASPSSLTGSVGVYTLHEDDSAMLDAAGIKLELIRYGANKAEGNSLGPLTDSAREHLQQIVDTYGIAFEKAVARGRGIKQDEVHSKFGQGRVFDAKTAVRIGMADRVGTLADVLGQAVSSKSGGSARAVFNGTCLGCNAVELWDMPSAYCNDCIAQGKDAPTPEGTVLCKGGCGGLLWANMHLDYCLSCIKATVSADDGCTCDCVPCDGGDCADCNHDDCDCAGCTCEMAKNNAKAKAQARVLFDLRVISINEMRHAMRLAELT